jgi:hypothetical protein
MTAKLKPMNFDYELIFQAQQDLEKNGAFCGSI